MLSGLGFAEQHVFDHRLDRARQKLPLEYLEKQLLAQISVVCVISILMVKNSDKSGPELTVPLDSVSHNRAQELDCLG